MYSQRWYITRPSSSTTGQNSLTGLLRELFHMRPSGIHPMQTGRDQVRRPAAQHRVFTACRGEDDLAVGQVARMNVVRVPTGPPPRDLLGFVRRRERNLPQSGAVDVHFPDAEARAGILPEIKDDLRGIERQTDLADEALPPGRSAAVTTGRSVWCARCRCRCRSRAGTDPDSCRC